MKQLYFSTLILLANFTLYGQCMGFSAATNGSNYCAGSSSMGSATATEVGGSAPYTYQWSNGSTLTTTTNLYQGVYTVTITDNNGCSASSTVTIDEINVSANITSQTNIACFGESTGAATASGSNGDSPYTYMWSNGMTSPTTNNLAAGTYTTTITDNNGCSGITSAIITEPNSAISAGISSTTNVSCNGGTDGTVTASGSGGAGSYTYLWSNGSTTATSTGLAAGMYTSTVTDANGCTATASTTITEPSAITVSAMVTSNYNGANITCNGAADGEVTASTSGGFGPYTYLWSNGATTATVTNLFAGVYSSTVTDANGCTEISSITLNEPSAVSASINSITHVTCNGNSDGSLTVDETGGTGAYTYLWSNGATTQTNSGLSAGSYTTTLTDANGCNAIASATVTEPSVIDLTVNNSNSTLSAVQTGASYQWVDCNNSNADIPNETGQSFSPSVSGNYAVEITVGNCTQSSSCESVTVSHVGITEEVTELGLVSIYPNPSNGLLSIELNEINSDLNIMVYNVLGEQLIHKSVKELTTNLDISDQDAGVYFIKIYDYDNAVVRRIVKQ